MKHQPILLAVGVACITFWLPGPAMARSCVQSGMMVQCSDGSQYQTFGNTTTDNRGNVWRHDRELSIGSNGRIIQRLPGQHFDPRPGPSRHNGLELDPSLSVPRSQR
jgi:hypothetical protein